MAEYIPSPEDMAEIEEFIATLEDEKALRFCPDIKLAGFISDDGKEFCMELYGMSYGHLYVTSEILHIPDDHPGYHKFEMRSKYLMTTDEPQIYLSGPQGSETRKWFKEKVSEYVKRLRACIDRGEFKWDPNKVPYFDGDHVKYMDASTLDNMNPYFENVIFGARDYVGYATQVYYEGL